MSGVLLVVTIPSINKNAAMERIGSELRTEEKENTLRKLLGEFEINDASWILMDGGRKWQISFLLSAGPDCDEILAALAAHEFGYTPESCVAVIPCIMARTELPNSPSNRKPTIWGEAARTVRARIAVAHAVEAESKNASLNFDFILKVLMSSIIAALGLVENFSVFVVSSMLLSPLLGPVLAVTFGSQVGDKRLCRKGILSEAAGLLTCLLVGIICGTIFGAFGRDNYLTEEMISRSSPRALWVGALIAIPSGGAVALAVLGDDTASLVGVAISVSLMPPAVNAGLLWALSVSQLIYSDPPKLTHVPIYDERAWSELALLGATSLCLTFINIIFIIGAALLLLKFKEITPIVSPAQRQFWTEDLKIAREINNKTFHGSENEKLWSRTVNLITQNSGTRGLLKRQVQWTWSPNIAEPRPSIRDLENFYTNS